MSASSGVSAAPSPHDHVKLTVVSARSLPAILYGPGSDGPGLLAPSCRGGVDPQRSRLPTATPHRLGGSLAIVVSVSGGCAHLTGLYTLGNVLNQTNIERLGAALVLPCDGQSNTKASEFGCVVKSRRERNKPAGTEASASFVRASTKGLSAAISLLETVLV